MSKVSVKDQELEAALYQNIGTCIVKLFGLKRNKLSRYNTTVGDKTIQGIGRTVERLLQQEYHKISCVGEQEAKWYIVDQEGNEMFHGKEFASSTDADCYISEYILDNNHDMHHEDEKYYEKMDEFVLKQRKEIYE